MKLEVKRGDGTVIETIDRKPFHKGFMGNFIPHWARYRGKIYLIQGGIDYAYMHGDKPLGIEYYIQVDKVT